MHWESVALLLAMALAVNVPLGAWRRSQRKFSPSWFAGIHASIPLLFAARLQLDVPAWVIPVEIAFVVAGQVLGSRLPVWRGVPSLD